MSKPIFQLSFHNPPTPHFLVTAGSSKQLRGQLFKRRRQPHSPNCNDEARPDVFPIKHQRTTARACNRSPPESRACNDDNINHVISIMDLLTGGGEICSSDRRRCCETADSEQETTKDKMKHYSQKRRRWSPLTGCCGTCA